MCKKYVNTTVDCFENILYCDGQPIAFQKPFDKIITDNSQGGYRTGCFKMVTHINVLGSADDAKKQNNILYDPDGRLDIIIRLTKCDKDPDKRSYYDLDSFSINVKELKDNNQIDGACFEFFNYLRVTTVPELELQNPGLYVIKVLIKDQKDEDYSVQYIKKFIAQ